MSARPARVLPLGLALLALLAVLLSSPASARSSATSAPSAPDPVGIADVADASAALEEVRELFDEEPSGPADDGSRDEQPAAPDEVDATLALRELAQRQDALPADEAREAASLLARPTDGDSDPLGTGYTTPEATPACSDVVCIHYVTTTRDKVPAADDDTNGVPDYVDRALTTQTDVHRAYVAAGYRAPKPDGTRGGDALTDIYLADVGAMGFYGYCTSDERLRGGERGAWAYCVLDNDFSRAQFSANTPQENYQVTAAHEYFHAVQFGYDYFEDAWFMEATATWAEDELFDGIDDNRQFLSYSPITRPGLSMDQFTDTFHYGTWIFFRHLSEKLSAEQGVMPTLVRDMWRRADNAGGRAGEYSLLAIRRVLGQRDTSLVAEFARFSQANRMSRRNYAEGETNRYPIAPAAGTLALTPQAPSQARTLSLDHLTSGTVVVTPSASFASTKWRLRVGMDLSPARRGTAAVLTVVPRSGAPRTLLVPLGADGDAVKYARFSAGSVKRVEVTLVNASSQFRCDVDTIFSCGGRSRSDSLAQSVKVRAYRAG